MPIALMLGSFMLWQAPAGQKPLPPRFTHAVRSPEVSADRRVTFRLRAPNAKSVILTREGGKRVPMTKDDKGVWSLTTEPLPPDYHVYAFIVDGVLQGDPSNPLVKAKVMGGHESLVHVPGPAPLSWENANVPHGTLHCHTYQSKVIGEERSYWVYTPPGYDPRGAKKYPVMYLLHGVTDDATAWITAGRAPVILDNLIAQGKAQPMLLVMPLGYGFANAPDRVGEMLNGQANQQKVMEVFAAMLLEEVLPQVERQYQVDAERASRAVAGLSMGGSQALYLGLKHRDRFGWVGAFSGAFVMFGGQFEKWFPDPQSGRPAQFLWVVCGTEDFLIHINRKCRDWLQSKHIPCTYTEMPGGHVWALWKPHLEKFASLCFAATKE